MNDTETFVLFSILFSMLEIFHVKKKKLNLVTWLYVRRTTPLQVKSLLGPMGGREEEMAEPS